MKKKFITFIVLFVIFAVLLIASYNYAKNKYYKHLYDITGDILNVSQEEISEINYKKLSYERIIWPGCEVGSSLDYEKIYFKDDTTVVVEVISDPVDNTFLFRRFFGIKKGKKKVQEYVLKNDTLFAKVPIISGKTKYTIFFPFYYKVDSLHIGFYGNKLTAIE